MTDEAPKTAPTVRTAKDPGPPADRKPRDVIPLAKIEMRSDLTLQLPGYPGGATTVTAGEQIKLEYHTLLGLVLLDWKPRPGGVERPFKKYIPREWVAFEPL